MSSDMEQKMQEYIEGSISENEALRVELSNALARVGELEIVAKKCEDIFEWLRMDIYIKGYLSCESEAISRISEALSRPTLGAASRLRDETLEEAANIGYSEVLKATESITASLRVRGAIRARKSKEADR